MWAAPVSLVPRFAALGLRPPKESTPA